MQGCQVFNVVWVRVGEFQLWFACITMYKNAELPSIQGGVGKNGRFPLVVDHYNNIYSNTELPSIQVRIDRNGRFLSVVDPVITMHRNVELPSIHGGMGRSGRVPFVVDPVITMYITIQSCQVFKVEWVGVGKSYLWLTFL